MQIKKQTESKEIEQKSKFSIKSARQGKAFRTDKSNYCLAFYNKPQGWHNKGKQKLSNR